MARVKEIMRTGFWCGNLKQRGRLRGLGMDKTSILKWILKRNRMRGRLMDSSGSQYGPVVGYSNMAMSFQVP